MPGTVKSELLPDADRSHKCDCQEKVSWKRNLPLDKSHFITETSILHISLLQTIEGLTEEEKQLSIHYLMDCVLHYMDEVQASKRNEN